MNKSRSNVESARGGMLLWGRALAASCAALALLTSIGSVQAQVSVSSSGTPSYSYAIAVPPGIAGMQPNLTLLYSGSGAHGAVGKGWAVQGVSVISRCQATRQIDGAPKSVTFTGADKLCLDGQRLIQTDANGIPLPSQVDDAKGLASGYREYRTENDSFTRIRAYGATGANAADGPLYFKVWTKGGHIYQYGNPPNLVTTTGAMAEGVGPTAPVVEAAITNGAIAAQGKTAISDWAVARVSDMVGNYIDFKYERRVVRWGSGPTGVGPTSGSEWNIAEIQYTGNSATLQLPANKVVFRYINREQAGGLVVDASETYHRGSKSVSVRLLKSIETYVNSPNPTVLGKDANAVQVRSVNLTYERKGAPVRSLLTQINECAGGSTSTCMPPTRFDYSTGALGGFSPNNTFRGDPLWTTPLMNNVGTLGVVQIDFDGDGRTDLLRWSDTPNQNMLYRSVGDGSFENMSNFDIKDQNLFKSDLCYTSLITDFNGDGLSDILRSSTCSGGQPSYLYLSRGNGSFDRRSISGVTLSKRLPVVTGSGSTSSQTAGETYYVMDVNADGLPDIVRTIIPSYASNSSTNGCQYQTCTWVYAGDGYGAFTGISTNMANVSLFRYGESYVSGIVQQRHVTDVDGDGYPDLVLGAPNGPPNTWVDPTMTQPMWRSLVNGNFETYAGGDNMLDCAIPIDFNGDGRTECLWPGATIDSNRLTVSTGTGLVRDASTNLRTDGPILVGVNFGAMAIDINGDGRTDILRWADDPTANVLLNSNGIGDFIQPAVFSLNTPESILRKSDRTADSIFGDFLGNGLVQILRLIHNPSAAGPATVNELYDRYDPMPPGLLVSVVSPSGLKTDLTYASLTSTPANTPLAQRRYVSDREAGQPSTPPLVDLKHATPVVITAATDVGVGADTVKTEYAYRGLKAAIDGRGMLGFRQVIQQNTGPNGEALSTSTDYLLDEPYLGFARRTETRRGAWNSPGQLLSWTTNTYCDRTSATSPGTATDTAPCTTTAKVRRPYLRRSVEEGADLGGNALPKVTTVNTYDDFGNATAVSVTTEGTFAGGVRQYIKSSANTFCAPDSAGCPNKISGDNWVLGRLTSSTVTNTAPNLLSALSASAGTAPNATATVGTVVSGQAMNPAVLSAILQLLLDD